jgi:hypothetical protein
MTDQDIKTRFNVLYWAIGIVAAVEIAILANLIRMSFQLGHITGNLAILIAHVALK